MTHTVRHAIVPRTIERCSNPVASICLALPQRTQLIGLTPTGLAFARAIEAIPEAE